MCGTGIQLAGRRRDLTTLMTASVMSSAAPITNVTKKTLLAVPGWLLFFAVMFASANIATSNATKPIQLRRLRAVNESTVLDMPASWLVGKSVSAAGSGVVGRE
jgi:hypothetical protein